MFYVIHFKQQPSPRDRLLLLEIMEIWSHKHSVIFHALICPLKEDKNTYKIIKKSLQQMVAL